MIGVGGMDLDSSRTDLLATTGDDSFNSRRTTPSSGPRLSATRTDSGGLIFYDLVEEERQSVNRRRRRSRLEDESSGSLLDNVRAALESATGFCDLLEKLVVAFALSVPCIILLVLLAALPVAMITLAGSKYTRCSSEELLPVWLLVFGVVLLFFILLQLKNVVTLRTCSPCSAGGASATAASDGEQAMLANLHSAKNFNYLILLFLLVWFGFGNFLIWRVYPTVHYQMPSKPPFEYCDKSLFLFCLALTLSVYSLLAVLCLVLCCVGCVWRRRSREYHGI